MKAKITLITLIAVAMVGGLFAADWAAYDMADYGTTANVTNSAAFGAKTLTDALITYDSSCTNTLAVYVTKDGIDYRVGTNTVTDGQYTSIDLTDITWSKNDVLKITTTITNVNVLVRSE